MASVHMIINDDGDGKCQRCVNNLCLSLTGLFYLWTSVQDGDILVSCYNKILTRRYKYSIFENYYHLLSFPSDFSLLVFTFFIIYLFIILLLIPNKVIMISKRVKIDLLNLVIFNFQFIQIFHTFMI